MCPSFEHPLLRCFGALQEPTGTSTSGQSRVTLQSGKEQYRAGRADRKQACSCGSGQRGDVATLLSIAPRMHAAMWSET